jgi:hypothetical protein
MCGGAVDGMAGERATGFEGKTVAKKVARRGDKRLIFRPCPVRDLKPFLSSSVVERSAVNRLVVGSNPTSGATSSNSRKSAYCVLVKRSF